MDDLALEMANLTDLRHTLDILTDNLSSFYFCTYAMISLGICLHFLFYFLHCKMYCPTTQ